MPTNRQILSGVRLSPIAKLQWVALLMAVALLPGLAFSAAPAEKKPANKEKEKPPDKAKESETPKPEPYMLQTGDGLELALTYYPGTQGKKTIPIVLLHMWKQSRNDYKDLATALQAAGYAVIVPDLRGHGKSVHVKGAVRDETLDAAKMPPLQFTRMVTQDMEAIKEFLRERNNAGELNIDKLCVVGAEMGASVALCFALDDAVVQESNRVFGADREYKVGRFVKALVLISPTSSFRGLSIKEATVNREVQRDIAMLILVGKQEGRALKEAERIHGIFEKYHPEPPGDNKNDKRTLFIGKLDTSLQGAKLLDPKFNLPSIIADFIYRRLERSEESREWTWRERKIPHG